MQLVTAEQRYALAETEIREEVSSEMASLLHDMEASYKVQHCSSLNLCCEGSYAATAAAVVNMFAQASHQAARSLAHAMIHCVANMLQTGHVHEGIAGVSVGAYVSSYYNMSGCPTQGVLHD